MSTQQSLADLASLISLQATREGYSTSSLPGLGYVRQSASSPHECSMYEPVLCLILRGRKRTTAGPLDVHFGPGESLIVSHDLPVMSEVTDAPYLALILALDMDILGTLVDQIQAVDLDESESSSLAVHATDEALIDALLRYARLADNPIETAVLAPLILKEIHFRLATAPHGGMLRTLLRTESTEHAVSKAIQVIRTRYREALSVPELASRFGMSESTFHRHFRSVTGTTPLQYQKTLRLLEARRLISSAGFRISSAAYEVGYASSTQFSREYSREFGVPPREHANGASN